MILNTDRNEKINTIFNNFLSNKNYNIIIYMDGLPPIEINCHVTEIFDNLFKNISERTTKFVICENINHNFVLSIKELFNGKLEIIL